MKYPVRIAIAGFQRETNTFAPHRADYHAFSVPIAEARKRLLKEADNGRRKSIERYEFITYTNGTNNSENLSIVCRTYTGFISLKNPG